MVESFGRGYKPRPALGLWVSGFGCPALEVESFGRGYKPRPALEGNIFITAWVTNPSGKNSAKKCLTLWI
ncbi:MAG: hypothetical protein DRI57_11320 [Deltaproteobacteria bacterium]|nr:MAG: hypothetical protein DRI57_11320 [Deltaproteobacteria bacterium]